MPTQRSVTRSTGKTTTDFTVSTGISSTSSIGGTVIANAGTNLNTSALALESGGNLAGVVTRIGEVQASPTANTLLDRLKSIWTRLTDGTQTSSIVDAASSTRKAEFDSYHSCLVVSSIEHDEIHEGASFTYRDVVTLGSAGVQDYLITTPNTTKWAHFGYEISSQEQITIDFYEATDKTGTTLQTNVFDRNRNTSNSATTTVHKDTSGGTTDGTLLLSRTEGSSTGATRFGSQVGQGQERVLKQNTKYIFRVTSGAASNIISVRLSWYEHISG